MGLAGLTAVFGMGTGGAPPVWSPELGRGVMKPPGRVMIRGRDTAGSCVVAASSGSSATSTVGDGSIVATPISRSGPVAIAFEFRPGPPAWCRRRRVGVVKPFGC